MTRAVVYIIFSLMTHSVGAYGADSVPHLPDEYESTSGLGSAINNGGVGATDSFSAISVNPALITGQKTYITNGVYHWPTEGRDYYQAGVVDSKTSSVAAGVSYTGFLEDFKYQADDNGKMTGASAYDSPLNRRISLALAQEFGTTSVGIGGTFVEGHPVHGSLEQKRGEKRITGTGLNIGVATLLTPGWSLGVSAQNVSTKKIKDYAPRTYRMGTTYQFSQFFTGYVDIRQRDRVAQFESPLDLDAPSSGRSMQTPERMLIASGTIQVQEYLKILASYGESLSDDRRALAAGAALTNKNFSLSYSVARPYMKPSTAHQALMISFEMAMQ